MKENYLPEEIEVIISDEVKEMFPATILKGKSLEDIFSVLGSNLVCSFPTNAKVTRFMDAHEKQELRDEYCLITENELPQAERDLVDAIEQAKRIKKDAEEELDAVRRRIANLASEVKEGTRELELPSKGTIQFSLNGYKLTYAFVNGQLQLMRGEKLTPQDRQELWSAEGRNRDAFYDLFGIEFPEVERPDDAKPQNFEEALSDALDIKDEPTH